MTTTDIRYVIQKLGSRTPYDEGPPKWETLDGFSFSDEKQARDAFKGLLVHPNFYRTARDRSSVPWYAHVIRLVARQTTVLLGGMS